MHPPREKPGSGSPGQRSTAPRFRLPSWTASGKKGVKFDGMGLGCGLAGAGVISKDKKG